MTWAGAARNGLRRLLSSYVFYVIIGIVVGAQLAPFAVSAGLDRSIDRGTVAVVPVEGVIDGGTAMDVRSRLQEARANPDVEAVVLLVNSPGGGAAASEALYLAVRRTADRMPVVASVASSATSGAYYASVPADRIFTTPSSMVGSVGAFAILPAPIEPVDDVIASGPGKLRGGDKRAWQYRIEAVQTAFLNAVMAGRGDALAVSRESVSRAEFFAGSVAVERGYADRIGDLDAAIRSAANLAGLDSYRVRTVRAEGTATFVSRSTYLASSAPDKRLVDPAMLVGAGDQPAALPNVVLLPRSVIAAARTGNATAAEVTANG